MQKPTTHDEQLHALKRIEGQVKGIQRMIEEKRYCVDIITQLHSIIGALYRVEDNIFRKHIDRTVILGENNKSVAADKHIHHISFQVCF